MATENSNESNNNSNSGSVDDPSSVRSEMEDVGEFSSQINDIFGTDELSPSECIDELEAIIEQRDELQQKLSEKQDYIENIESKLEQEREEFKQFRENRKDRLEKDRKQQVEDLFTELSDVHSQLYRALTQDHENIESFHEGVQIVFNDLEGVFASENVVCVDPDPGDGLNPRLHNIVTTCESEYDSNTIVEVYTPGYEYNGTVLEPAQVVVSE